MKKLALSVVVLLVAGAGAGVAAVGCSSSSSSSGDGGTGGDSSVVPGDDGGGTEAATDDGGSTEAATDDGGGNDTGTTETGAMCTDGGALGVVGADGGPNTACTDAIAASCGNEQCLCTTDTAMVPFDDAGTMVPACEAYAYCVYYEFSVNLQTSDAGTPADLMAAQATCAAKGFPTASVALGDAFYVCLASNQNTLTNCVP